MTERPILFSAPMVRALLDGSKTQTRRALRHQVTGPAIMQMAGARHAEIVNEHGVHIPGWECPYGQPGDRLWVRETWGVVSNAWGDDGSLVDWTLDRPATAITEMRFGQGYYSGHAIYAADGSYEWAGDDDGGGEPRTAWHPSIHMPRAASRILLEIVSVRVERLQDISQEDAMAEGVWTAPHACHGNILLSTGGSRLNHVGAYANLWDDINGPGSWTANPWVWVVEFRRVAP